MGSQLPAVFQKSNVNIRRWDLAQKVHHILLKMCTFVSWLYMIPGLLFLLGKGIWSKRIESTQLGYILERALASVYITEEKLEPSAILST